MSDDELDLFLSKNIPDIINIFNMNDVLNIIVENGNLFQAYLAIYPYIKSNDYGNPQSGVFSLELKNLTNFLTITNFVEINKILRILRSKTQYFSVDYRILKESDAVIKLLGDQLEILNDFVFKLNQKFNIYVGTFHQLKFDYTLKYYQNLFNYIEHFKQPNFLTTHQVRYLDDPQLPKFLHETLHYNFQYFIEIYHIDIFTYLYNQTDFKEFVDSSISTKAYLNSKNNILSYISHGFENFQSIVDQYFKDDVKDMINHCKFKYSLTFDMLKYLIDIGYDYNNLRAYKRCHTVDLGKIVEYLLNFDLSQPTLNFWYFNLVRFKSCYIELLRQIYNRIDSFIYTNSSINFAKFTDEIFKHITSKTLDLNLILKYDLQYDQLRYLFNTYDNFDHLLIVKKLVSNIDSLLYNQKDIFLEPHDYVEWLAFSLSASSRKIELLYKHNYLITDAEFSAIYHSRKHRHADMSVLREYFKLIIVEE